MFTYYFSTAKEIRMRYRTDQLSNYRPISNLSVITKLIEHVRNLQ